jgi:crotonobetainyl-CoA:carnitine CoA-transferase CaiB-like acyl-CoA transferase
MSTPTDESKAEPQVNEDLPLSGLLVVDWTHVLAGPFASYQLALLGASVVRIERSDGHDIVRHAGSDAALSAAGMGEAFLMQGAGKQSLSINAKHPEAKPLIAALIAKADVLIENYRPGKLAELGFDPARLVVDHPQLVVCSITGFGPDSQRRAYDHVIQAHSGLMMANQAADGQPQRIGFPMVDYAVGQQAAMAVLAALYRRDARTASQARKVGEWLQVTMTGAALSLMAPAFAEALVSGTERPRTRSTAFSGSALSGTFEAGGGWIAIVCNTPAQSSCLLEALLGTAASSAQLTALELAASARNVDAAQSILQAILATETAEFWDQRFEQFSVPATRVLTPVEAARDAAAAWPRVKIPAMGGHGERSIPVPGIGYTSNKPLTAPELAPPPRRGRDSRAVATELGFDSTQIEQLIQARVLFAN